LFPLFSFCDICGKSFAWFFLCVPSCPLWLRLVLQSAFIRVYSAFIRFMLLWERYAHYTIRISQDTASQCHLERSPERMRRRSRKIPKMLVVTKQPQGILSKQSLRPPPCIAPHSIHPNLAQTSTHFWSAFIRVYPRYGFAFSITAMTRDVGCFVGAGIRNLKGILET
jgi:hypothetical protein